MLTIMDIRHCLKILLLVSLPLLVTLEGEIVKGEGIQVNSKSQGVNKFDLKDFAQNNEEKTGGEVEKKNRVMLPQLIPDRAPLNRLGKRGRKGRRKRPKKNCKSKEFWHARGQKCVPRRCPQGTRRVYDGECVEFDSMSQHFERPTAFAGRRGLGVRQTMPLGTSRYGHAVIPGRYKWVVTHGHHG